MSRICIGEGSTCLCFRETNENGGRIVKQLTDLAQLPRFRAGYELQTRLCRGKAAPYVVKPLEARLEQEPYEQIFADDQGITLDQVQFGHIREVLEAVRGAALALHQLHKNQLVYVDVKANNFLRCADGQIKLFDFDSVLDIQQLRVGQALHGPAESTLADPNICEYGEVSTVVTTRVLPYLTPRLDVYGLGAMLYALLLQSPPYTKKESKPALRQDLRVLCSNRFRGQLTAAQQARLYQIMIRATQIDPAQRYASAAKLAHSLKQLLDWMETDLPQTADGSEDDRLLTAAWVLHRYPLFRYYAGGEFSVTLVGDSLICREFFELIFACAQMPVSGVGSVGYRPLIIRVMTDDPKGVQQKLEACGDLQRFINVTVENEKKKTPAKGKVEIFATVEIQRKHPHKLARHILKQGVYAILADGDAQKNVDVAEELFELLKESKKGKELRAVLVGDLRSDSADPRSIVVPEELTGVDCCTFAINGITAKEERAFRTQVEDMAFLLHSYYERQQNQRVNPAQMRYNFQQIDAKRSSIRSALTVPYKLAALAKQNDPSAAAYLCGLLAAYDANPEKPQPELQKLLHMEHRSWQCFALTQGWKLPAEDVLKKYAFTEQHPNHKLKHLNEDPWKGNYHACLAGSDATKSHKLLPLAALSRAEWETADLRKMKLMLDALDGLSLEMHRLCARRVEILEASQTYQTLFDGLKQQIPDKTSEAFCRACDLEIVGKKLLYGQSQTDNLWRQILGDLRSLLAGLPEAAAALEALQYPMSLVLERNSYRDYKRSDLDLIRAIPEMLTGDAAARIYTLYSDTDWCNLVTAILVDAKELVLLYDPSVQKETDVQQRCSLYQDFFNTRVLPEADGAPAVQVTCLPMESDRVSRRGALDITGSTPQMVHRAMCSKRLRKLSVVCYENGKLKGLTENGPLWDLYNLHGRDLSVGETLQLAGNTDMSAHLENSLLATHDRFKQLWDEAKEIGARDWGIAAKYLDAYVSPDYPINALDDTKSEGGNWVALDAAMLEKLGLKAVLDALKDKGELQRWEIAKSGELLVTAQDSDCNDPTQNQIRRLQSCMGLAPDLQDRYELRQVANWRNPETPAFVIHDRCCEASVFLDFTGVTDQSSWKEQREKKAALQAAVQAKPALERLEEKGLIRDLRISIGDVISVRFAFADAVVRESLLKAGNVLEMMAYHAISDSGLFDDVKPNVCIHWESGAGLSRQTANEVDLICTKGVRTYFVSCKRTAKLEQSYYDQVWYQAHRLGVDAVPVLLYARNEDDTGVASRAGRETQTSRGERMGVKTIEVFWTRSAEATVQNIESKFRNLLKELG